MVNDTQQISKGYKQTDVGVIPVDWGVFKLNELMKIYRGGSPRPIQAFLTNRPDGINWIKIGDVSVNAKYILHAEEKIIKEGADHSRRVFVGDFVLSNSMSFGRPYITRISGCVHDGWLVLQDYQNNFDTEFLFYLLSSAQVLRQYKQKAAGSGVLNLNKELVSSVDLLKPSLSDQKKIAKVLSDLDNLILKFDQLIQKKKNIKQGAMQKLLTGKKRLPGFANSKDMKETVVGKIPVDWNVTLLPEIINYIHGKAHEKFIVKQGKYIVVNSKFVSSNGQVKKYSNNVFCKAKKGDILTVLSDLPKGKALAKCYYVTQEDKYAVNQRVCIWRSKGAYSKFLYYILNRNPYFLSLDDGVSQTHILNHHIKKCPVLLPSNIKEQIAIADFLSQMDLEIIGLNKKFNKYKKLKQGMMQQLLTGKIRLI
ncbi:MAG: hypothetical protein COU65_03130 [Candidatus Pacebacteria bacterium CG10_big_fil_rev_8_21_14_0_10_42_12]|nr:MAG: hypothetical protein COU65_03130 [Candidatus Pacebacteria bacterium CG10_big_fil_rev_8_21_14_0_10_42_12]